METIITELLGNYAFPIVMSIVLIYLLYKQNENHKTEIEKLTKAYSDTTKELTSVINSNTQALTILSERINAWSDREEGA